MKKAKRKKKPQPFKPKKGKRPEPHEALMARRESIDNILAIVINHLSFNESELSRNYQKNVQEYLLAEKDQLTQIMFALNRMRIKI